MYFVFRITSLMSKLSFDENSKKKKKMDVSRYLAKFYSIIIKNSVSKIILFNMRHSLLTLNETNPLNLDKSFPLFKKPTKKGFSWK